MNTEGPLMTESPPPSRQWPLYVRILIGVAVGVGLGQAFGDRPILFGWTNADNGTVAGLFIQTLTTLATPLIFFAIVEAFVQTQLTGRQGAKMFVICAVNIAAAFLIGLTILNVFQPGKTWQPTLEARAARVDSPEDVQAKAKAQELADRAAGTSLSPLAILRSYIPKSILQPFSDNMVLTVAVLAILVGAGMRSLKGAGAPEVAAAMAVFESLMVACYQILLQILRWLIELAPYAICLAVANAVGTLGPDVFEIVGVFVVTVVAALAIHSLVYYPLTAWIVGRKSPRVFLGEGLPAILTGLSINSSLATAPLTLEALRRMGVSESSARLSACVGTNFNNDGITLYEAITALFVAQAIGQDLGLGQQIAILLAALAGSMGIAGIPNSGLIILALVLKAAQFSDETIQLVLPIVYSVDVLNGRLRSGVNVMGDLQVAVLLDAGESGE